MEATPFFIYARKSSRNDDRQALSIPAQLRALDTRAAELNLTVVDRIIERESAHTPGRIQFTKMMQRIEAGEARGILAWHPDRLARNSRDGGEIIYFLDSGKLVDLKFPSFWFENTPQGKANLGHEFVQTKQFSDKLSCDTKRGLMEKVQSGYYPSHAPLGYLNNKATKTIELDPILAPIIKGAFERYALGNLTIDGMRAAFAAQGILTVSNKRRKNPGGRFIARDSIRRLLRNPFYYGHFKYTGELHEGKHPPLITKQLFDKVQEVLTRRGHTKQPKNEPKAFVKLLRCGECGMSITAEVQKGQVYYRCTRQSRKIVCSQPYIREEDLSRELSHRIAECAMPKNMADYMLKSIDEEMRVSTQTAAKLIEQNHASLAEISQKQQKLLDAYLDSDGLIDRETFMERKRNLLNEKKRLQDQIVACEDRSTTWLERFKDWVLMAQPLGEIAFKLPPKEKRALAVSIFGSNLTLVGKKAAGKAVKQWSLLQNLSHNHSMVRACQSARTIFLKNV